MTISKVVKVLECFAIDERVDECTRLLEVVRREAEDCDENRWLFEIFEKRIKDLGSILEE